MKQLIPSNWPKWAMLLLVAAITAGLWWLIIAGGSALMS
jgi:hypothetical protein